MDFDKETQVRILRVAADRQGDRSVEENDEHIAAVMDLHPEFDEIWQQGELATFPQEINGMVVNPFVHTVLHVIVDKQIRDGNPEIAAETFKKLTGQGMDEHETLHAIIAQYADIHFGNFRQGKPFDHLDYHSRLQQLSYE
ncbi:MAG: DUF1841 family protein [Nitrospinaceae bacterium]